MIAGLLDRSAETAALGDALAKVREGLRGVLVLRGDPGVGKTVLLEWAAGQAPDMQVARTVGVQAEMGMGFAGLHQLLVPFLGGLDGLPGPQRLALGSAFGLADGPPPDRFLVGLAALTLLTDASAAQPVLCLVDDAQWLDQASVEVLGFIARRLYADRVGMVFAVREGDGPASTLAGLPELFVRGLPDEAAGELFAASAGAAVDGQVSAQVVAGVAGNPLALVELAGELTPEELSGGVPLAWPLRFGGSLEELYLARVRALPADTQNLMLVAAADPSGDPALAHKAAGELGSGLEAGEAAETEHLVTWQPRVRFRHPLIRSAAYYAASAGVRRRAHAALAAVTNPDADPDRRAWHLAEAAVGPDEQVAAELERSAGRAQARGGLAAAAAFLERSLQLTADPAGHAERILAAAQVNVQAGAFGRALELLATAETGSAALLAECQRARIDLLRGQIAFVSSMGRDAPSLLLKAAKQLESIDLDLARQTYLTAWAAAGMAGHLASADLLEISLAARALSPAADSPSPVGLLLDGVSLLVTDGPAAAAPVLRRAADVFTAADLSIEELRWGSIATTALWDDDAGHMIMTRQIQFDRAVGALSYLPSDLVILAQLDARRGDFSAAASLIAESDAAAEATGIRIAPFPGMLLAALRGDEADFARLTAASIAAAAAEGQGLAATTADWYAAILHNGLGRYEEAFAESSKAWEHSNVYSTLVVLPELVEAAVRTGHTQIAAEALDAVTATTQAARTDYALGIEARSRALVTEGPAAEGCYREAIDRLAHTQLRTEAARAHLVYGEWLRRQRRRRDAREQLRTAFEMFDSIGMEAFAVRARTELRATGERARPRSPQALEVLTPQEEQIARMAAEHLSNREIAARLFISAGTVEYHLRKIFRKLGITSRAEIARSLRDGRNIRTAPPTDPRASRTPTG